MNRREFALVAAFALTGGRAALAAKKQKGTLQADRAFWVLGMYVGTENGGQYPFVTQLDPEGAGKKAGLRAGDELLRIGDEEVRSLKDLQGVVGRLSTNSTTTVWARRGAQTLRFELRVPKDPFKAGPDAEPKDGEKPAGENPDGEKTEGDDKKSKKKKKKAPINVKPIPPKDPNN